MTCQQFKKLIDSYVSDELLIETNHEVLAHLENCTDCRNELAVSREFRARLALTVKNSEDLRIDPAFAVRLKEDLRQTALKPGLWEKMGAFKRSILAAAVAGLILTFGLAVAFVVMKQSDGNFQIAGGVINEMVSLAVGDHENCAIHFALKEKPIPLAVAAGRFDRFYDGLDRSVTDALKNGDYKFVEAHSCVFEGQRFAHIVLRHGDNVVSVLVTKTESSDQKPPTSSGRFNGYQTATSLGTHYAFFVISDLSEQQNLALANDLSPAIASHMASI